MRRLTRRAPAPQNRAEMMEEIALTRERLAILSNDIEALDRVLERLGYDGDVKLTPRVPRITLFYRGELRQFLLGQLRENGAMTSRKMGGKSRPHGRQRCP
jgi:hypothetical protein